MGQTRASNKTQIPVMPSGLKKFFVDAGKRGAAKRFAGMTKEQRSEVNRKAALVRWRKRDSQ
jgi:hypothetical protein